MEHSYLLWTVVLGAFSWLSHVSYGWLNTGLIMALSDCTRVSREGPQWIEDTKSAHQALAGDLWLGCVLSGLYVFRVSD